MNITYFCDDPFDSSGSCPSASAVPGKEIILSVPFWGVFGDVHRIVESVPSDQILLVDTCARGRLKMVSDECQFVMPTNDDEWKVVRPILKELTKRQVLVLSDEVSYDGSELQIMKEVCRNSFYCAADGTLINETFAEDDKSPEKMAEAGFKFIGDAMIADTACYFNGAHKIGWSEEISPDDPPVVNLMCSCLDNAKYKIPVLSAEDGQIIPMQAYKVSMHSDHLSQTCNNPFLITHSRAPIKITPLSELVPTVDAAKSDLNSLSLEENRFTVKDVDSEYFCLLKESITFSHFSDLLRDFNCVNQAFISQLQEYKTQLHALTDLATAEALLKHLKSRSLSAELGETVKKLATLNLVTDHANRLNFLPPAIFKAISSGMIMIARKELQELADSYRQRYFIDDFLHGLVKNGTLGCLFTDDYFTSSKRCEKHMELLAKGIELSQSLLRISEAIIQLLEPYMDQSAGSCDLPLKVKALSLKESAA